MKQPREWDAEVAAEQAQAQAFHTLSHEEAQAVKARIPRVSPWRVIAMQIAVGMLVAGLAWLFTQQLNVAWSSLYGTATVVVPGALMARGMTSRLSGMSAGAGAMAFMVWEMVKIGVSVAMLMLAPRLVPALSWPALLVGLVVCMKVYWVALLWRR